MANFSRVDFSLVSRAEISARFLEQILMKSNLRLHGQGPSPGRNSARASLRDKCSRKKRTKFGPREGVFRILAARKMGREQKGGRKGWGEGGKKGTLARKPLNFQKRPLVFTLEFIY